MRVISDFHDYYDPLMDPTDRNNLFLRKTEKIERIGGDGYNPYWSDYYKIETIGFCGKIYPFFLFRQTLYDNWLPYWTWEEVKPQYEKVLLRLNNWKTRDYFRKNKKKSKEFSLPDNDWQSKIFRKYKCAYFHVSRKEITINPILKDFKFYKIFPPPQCYQEIEHYLFGVIAERREFVPEVSNKDLIEAKGFDLKISFRKEKNVCKNRRSS